MSACTCCGGAGEHKDGHECYVCDASGQGSEQGEASNVCEGHHGTPDDGPGNARERYGDPNYQHYSMGNTVQGMFYTLQSSERGYEGVTHAGIAVFATDTGRVFFAQRSYDETDAPEVQETWEFPGGGLDEDETPWEGVVREFSEEIGFELPPGEVVWGWRGGDEGQYQGFVYRITAEFPADDEFMPTEEVQAATWGDLEWVGQAKDRGILRPEVADGSPWGKIFNVVSGNEDDMTDKPSTDLSGVEALTEDEPALTLMDLFAGPIPIHGVLAPEAAESGDGRGFNAGAVTKRPGRLPFRWQKSDEGGHRGAVITGSVDRMMRKDGLIHYEGSLMGTPDAGDLIEVLEFFGRFGVSVDGDRGGVAQEASADGVLWYDAIRAAGLTAVDIPAFAEAYVALGPHPDMPSEETLTASMVEAGDLVTFDRGPGWITDPKETKRIHDYWTKKGQPGYAKIAWGTNGDFTRCTRLVGEKIATNSPEKARFIKQTCAQWHHDALGYWPGQANMPGNPTTEEIRRKRKGGDLGADTTVFDATDLYEVLDTPEKLIEWAKKIKDKQPAIDMIEDPEQGVWEAVLVSSADGARPPVEYFHRHDSGEALIIEDPDEHGFRRTYGYAAEWGVCHIGLDGRCVEPPRTGSDDYPEFHLGVTRVDGGHIYTGVLTYGVGHRDAETILSESPDQAYFDNVANSWAAVRVGEDERGIWFSGVVLPGIPEEHLIKIQASGQVSGEWKRGAMRACLTVNVPGYPVQRASAEYDDQGNVLALAASAFGSMQRVNGVETSECAQAADEDDPVGDLALAVQERITAREAIRVIRDQVLLEDFEQARREWEGTWS